LKFFEPLFANLIGEKRAEAFYRLRFFVFFFLGRRERDWFAELAGDLLPVETLSSRICCNNWL